MTEAVILVAAMLTFAVAILAALLWAPISRAFSSERRDCSLLSGEGASSGIGIGFPFNRLIKKQPQALSLFRCAYECKIAIAKCDLC